jgi:segregation and condensation protein B
MRLTQIVEALLFASDAPLTAQDIARVDERLDEDTVEAVIRQLRAEYEEGERAFQIFEVAGGYQLLTRPDFAVYLERYETIPQPARLSAPGLETLAIVAYRQPIGRAEIEEIRGVGSTAALKTLIDRGLVEVTARGEGLGRPLLYGTTGKFLEHFGFRSLEDMPRPEELPVVLRTRPAPTVDSLMDRVEAEVPAGSEATEELPAAAEPRQEDENAAVAPAK